MALTVQLVSIMEGPVSLSAEAPLLREHPIHKCHYGVKTLIIIIIMILTSHGGTENKIRKEIERER